jgi:TonB family protein
MKSLLVLLALASLNMKPADVAYLVLEKDAATIAAPLHDALAAPDALTRATAARVVAVRDLKALVPDVRAALEHESDAVAAREQLRTLALLGDENDIDAAIAATAKWPASIDGDVAVAIARRGGTDAVGLYLTKFANLRTFSRHDFFRIALWGRLQAMTYTAARLVGAHDERGWDAYLQVLGGADVAIDPGVLTAALDSTSEAIRVDSVWYVVRQFAPDPAKLPQPIRDAIAKEREAGSLREDFGRELVRRMSGAPTQDTHRFADWLESPEADEFLGNASDAVYGLLTESEYKVRHNRCGTHPTSCAMPAKKPVRRGNVAPVPVPPAALQVPGELPTGLSDQLSTCSISWLGVVAVTVDGAGRVQTVEQRNGTSLGPCFKGVETMLRLSYATNTSVLSPRVMPDVIVVHAARDTICLDEDPPSNDDFASPSQHGGIAGVTAPVKIRSVDPVFPEGRALPRGTSAIVILEAVITKHGCVRSVRPVAESPYGELNAAAILAMSQWKFSPGRIDGKPVDVTYNLTVNFKSGR